MSGTPSHTDAGHAVADIKVVRDALELFSWFGVSGGAKAEY